MALINCPECNKEVSDKVKNCIHCGYPLQEDQSIENEQENDVQQKTERPLEEVQSKVKKNPIRVVVPIIAGVVVIIVAVAVYAFTNAIPNGKYNDALALLERGKYDEANVLLGQLGSFKDTETIFEQIRYESIAYNCINDLKKYLKNPDSYSPYEITFYQGEEAEEDDKPSCVMHYGAQNGFGGNTTGYALFTYSEEKSVYSLFYTCDSLDEDDLDEDDDDYLYEKLTVVMINTLKDSGTKVGDIDMARLKVVLKNDAYSTIKVID